jgi:AcrR family transcriptional regulator
MSSPPTRPALRERYDRRERAIVDAAASVFAQRGFHATSIEDLVEATGLARGGLYHYIGSKQQLLFRVFEELMAPLLDRAREILEADETAEQRLRRLAREWMAHVEAHHDHMVVFTQERRTLERDPQWQRVVADRQEFERILGELLRQGVEAGELAPGDPHLVALAFMGMVNYTPVWFDPSRRLTATQVADGFCDVLFDGIRRPG